MPPAPLDNPSHTEASAGRQRGQQALRAGRPAEARQAFRAALAADPGDAAAWLGLARLSSPHARLAYTAKAIELSRGLPVAGRVQPDPSPVQARARSELRRARRLAAVGPGARSAFLAPALAGGDGMLAVVRPAPRPAGWPLGQRGASALAALVLFVALLAAAAPAGRALRNFGVYWSPPPVARALAQLSRPAATAASLPATSTAQPTAAPATATETSTPAASPSASPTPTPTATLEPSATPSASQAPASPAPAAAAERWVDVDLTHQSATAFEGQNPVRNFSVSTGTWDHPTVTGQYHIYVKYAAADMAGPGYYLPAVPYVMYFYEGYGLHGTYWHHNFGTPMSHGCVNFKTEDAAWLFDWAAVGTLVNVHY